jgi:acyl-homoserine lactone acylase PvdQ
LAEPIAVLKNWDYYAKENSVATTLANEWALLDPIIRKRTATKGSGGKYSKFCTKCSADQLPQLQMVVQELKTKFGTWEIPWGDINRFQRLSGDINLDYDDIASLPIVQLPGAAYPLIKVFIKKTKKRYGNSGNSFVCAVEFEIKLKLKSLLVGNSSDPKSTF